MFSKEPVVYANPHPDEQDYGYTGSHPANQKNASLSIFGITIFLLHKRGTNIYCDGCQAKERPNQTTEIFLFGSLQIR